MVQCLVHLYENTCVLEKKCVLQLLGMAFYWYQSDQFDQQHVQLYYILNWILFGYKVLSFTEKGMLSNHVCVVADFFF